MTTTTAHNLSIFIDGGYYNVMQTTFAVNFDFARFLSAITELLSQSVGPLTLLHTFYYDCLPWYDSTTTPEEYTAVIKRQSYLNFLRTHMSVLVREGKLVRHKGFFVQKKVDLLLGLDVAIECKKGLLTHMVLVSGDGDLAPAVEHASHNGVQTWLLHGPRNTYSDDLWRLADVRVEMSTDFVKNISKRK